MQRDVVITDLTRMSGARVCVAGYVIVNGQPPVCVRPELEGRNLSEQWLMRGQSVIRPFSVLRVHLKRSTPHPPHTEDWLIDPSVTLVTEALPVKQRWELLRLTSNEAVEHIFGAPIQLDRGWFIIDGEGRQSLGTIFPDRIWEVFYGPKPNSNKWEYRVAFRDHAGKRYKLSVTDLAFRRYLDSSLAQERMTPSQLAEETTRKLQSASRLALRIGLARRLPADDRNPCYLQINGVYSDPDYLNGRCWADFAANASSNARSQASAPDVDDTPF